MTVNVKLKEVRLGYPALYKAVSFDQNQPEAGKRFKADFWIPKTDKVQIDAINKAIIEEMKAIYKEKAPAMLKSFRANPQKFCFVDGDETLTKSGESVAPGHFVLRARRREQDGAPGVYDNRAGANGKAAVLTEGSSRIYAGCFVNASVGVWAQAGQYGGVRCNLLGVQYAKEGEAFGGSRPASADEFEALADEAEMAGASTDDFGLD